MRLLVERTYQNNAETTMKILRFFLPVVLWGASAKAQGTLVYDQQSRDVSRSGEGYIVISSLRQGAQSFTPALSGIDFASFWFLTGGSDFHVNIRSESVTGPVLGTTSDLVGAAPGPLTFFFPNTIPLSPGTVYYLELVPAARSGTLSYGSDPQFYAGGTGYVDGQPGPANTDFWFREGIVSVPEPTSWALLALGAGVVLWRRRTAAVRKL
jgi:hypothetical protein